MDMPIKVYMFVIDYLRAETIGNQVINNVEKELKIDSDDSTN
jgi:hypothetical protein